MRFTFNNSGKNGHLVIEDGKIVSAKVECDRQLSTLQDYISPSKLITINEIEKALSRFGFGTIEFIAPGIATTIDQTLQLENFYGSICIMREDKLILRKGYGFNNLAQGKLNTCDSYFYCDGLSEIVLSLVVSKLQKEGRLSFDDCLSHFFPAYCLRWPHLSSISIDMLLNHTSGLDQIAKRTSPITSQIPMHMIIKSIFRKQPLFSPGKYKKQSKANMLVLVSIIEQITSKPYSEHVKDLQFKEAFVEGNIEPAVQYDLKGNVIKKDHTCFQKGHSDLISTSFGMLEVLKKAKSNLDRRSLVKGFQNGEVTSLACGLTCDFLFGHRNFFRIEDQSVLYFSPKDKLTFCVLANKPMTEEFTLRKLISLITTNHF